MQKQSTVTKRFGQRVKELRLKNGLSQERLAEFSDLDRTYISGIERGIRNVSLKNIEAIAKGLHVSLAELFKDL